MTDTGDTTTSEEESEDIKKPIKEVPVVQEQGFFQHSTGDTYDGYFEAKKKDRSVKMHGPGEYKTSEGDVYTGSWEADRLGANEEVTITYTDGSRYEGMFKDWSYIGAGKYFYPDGSVLQCDFVENCPTGQLKLTDPNGHTWLGKAEQGFSWVKPVNHFYDMLEKTRDQSRIKRHQKSISDGIETEKSKIKM